jgi:hypothetical protein
VDASLDRTLPKIDNEARRRYVALDLNRLDELLKVFFARAIENVDAQAGLLVVKILERRALVLGLDSPQKLDIFFRCRQRNSLRRTSGLKRRS